MKKGRKQQQPPLWLSCVVILVDQHRHPNVSLLTIRFSTHSSTSWGICCFWAFSAETNSGLDHGSMLTPF